MKFRSAQRVPAAIVDITPLIDVVFLLLIFFMVSTTFEHNSEINITLPESSKEEPIHKPDAINISITAQGEIYVNDRPLINNQLLTLKNALSQAVAGLDEPPVIISADAGARHEHVVLVMDASRQLGLVKFSFATQQADIVP